MPRAIQSSGSCTGGGGRSTTVSFPAAGSPSKASRYWPDSACQRLPPSFTTTWSPTAPIDRPESGIAAGSFARRAFNALVMRRAGTCAVTRDWAVRSTIRSWKEKRQALRAPRAGATKPAATSARMVSRGRRSRRSTSPTPYGCVTAPDCVLRVFLYFLRGRNRRQRPLGRLALLLGRGRGGLRLRRRRRLLLQARAQRLHEVDHLRADLGLVGERDLLPLDLLLDRRLDAGGDRVGVLA